MLACTYLRLVLVKVFQDICKFTVGVGKTPQELTGLATTKSKPPFPIPQTCLYLTITFPIVIMSSLSDTLILS